ncbi:hypothetical protein [Antarctobacter jejuensis]|uniref:hypothetical protein n=1 Tax=Antarctobacter jejuensis TaxID=1439938 RepID=UPI003FCF06B9
MEPDMMLVVGMGLIVLSLPSILSAWTDSRAPRLGALLLLGGGGLAIWALSDKDGGYTWAEIPDVFYGVIGQILN